MDTDVIVVFGILAAAVAMFATEKIRNDVAAIIVMLALAWTGILPLEQAFSGFASNAVISIMGVMVISFGIEKTGIMDDLAQAVMKRTGTGERRVTAAVMGVTGLLSSFLQNIGSVALLLPAVRKIGNKSGISPKRLIMPMAFAGILGGTVTMVASGPLIILNDLLSDGGHDGFGLFSVTPVGLALLLSGILYFAVFSKAVLPGGKDEEAPEKDKLLDVYHLPKKIWEADVESGSSLAGKAIEELETWKEAGIHILALSDSGSKTYIPWRRTVFREGQALAVFGEQEQVEKFFGDYGLQAKEDLTEFSELVDEGETAFAEIILPPDSGLKGKTIKEIALRKNYKVEPILYVGPDGKRVDKLEGGMQPGLKAVVFGRREDLAGLKDSGDFVVITPLAPPKDAARTGKKVHALAILGASLVLVLLGLPLPLCFLSAAVVMVFAGVVHKEELYHAIDWKTVFLLAGLIPLGIAFERTGAAKLIAEAVVGVVESWNAMLILLAVGLVAAAFSLFMSNVAATVLLVPLILNMGDGFGIDPRALALLVAVGASNAFILPTHQVNAYVTGPGGYRTSDFMKAGGLMTVIFLLVSSSVIYLLYV